MVTIQDILNSGQPDKMIIEALKEKAINVPLWGGKKGLIQEYEPRFHPVMNRAAYPDTFDEDGHLEPVTRITYDLQRLATKRMTELTCGIPVKRIYSPKNDKQKEISKWLEALYVRNHIDSVNTERCTLLFASCEVLTLWYAVEQDNLLYGFDSKLKLRCKNFSPMFGDNLYPLFDEYGDMIALSVGYTRKKLRKIVEYFDTYSADRHIKWSNESGDWAIIEDDKITLGKIPAVYAYRPTPIWEDTSRLVYEMEWAMSRNGNYLRKNSKPLFALFADEQITYGSEQSEKKEFRSILQFPKGSDAKYITWEQAVENLKYYIGELRNSFFTQLQLPDWSYEKMSQQALSGESRKQLFIDAQMKVKDESGRLLEFFERETNILKAFLKVMLPDTYSDDIDSLSVETIITPYAINDDKDTITNLTNANGGKPLMSQRDSIERLGWSADPDKTMQEIITETEQSDVVIDGSYR